MCPIHTTEADATQTKRFCHVWRGGVNLLLLVTALVTLKKLLYVETGEY